MSYVCPLSGDVVDDLNHDAIDDEVIAGENSVVFADGASGKRTIVHKVTDTESEISSISECIVIHLGNKNGFKVEVYSYYYICQYYNTIWKAKHLNISRLFCSSTCGKNWLKFSRHS